MRPCPSIREPGRGRCVAALLSAGLAAAPAACGSGSGRAPGPRAVSITDVRQVVPSDGLPATVSPNRANNNLDIVDFDGRLFLAFRTAPTHFASDVTTMYIVSSADEGLTWDLEARFVTGKDLREPRFLVLDGARLFLYMAELGDDPVDFEPGRMLATERLAPGSFSEPEAAFLPTFIPWRVRSYRGRPVLIGYTGGEGIYDVESEPLDIYLLTTRDGRTFEPLDPERPVVLTGGGSETDIAFDRAGDLYAVVRNERGDETGFGSRICRAPADDITAWECTTDRRKYDSPLLVEDRGEIYLVGRRNVTEDGLYDLGAGLGVRVLELLTYELAYWLEPKRCSVWYLDREALAIDFLADLPSAGDTCFPSALPRGEGRFLLYNYSSDFTADGDPFWLQGQLGRTQIYAMTLGFD